MKVVSVEQMQRIEAQSDQAGHPYSAMMERAGRSLAEAIGEREDPEERRVLVLVGPGNNGGDGLVAARYLSQLGSYVTCYVYGSRDPEVDENFRLVSEAEIRVVLAEDDAGREELRALTERADILIDALLGTGTHLPLRGNLSDILEVAGKIIARRRHSPSGRSLTSAVPRPASSGGSTPFVVGVDGPTGLEYESGDLDAVTIPADLTVTFAYPKIGHFRFPGAAALGELVVADIGIDPALAEGVGLELATPTMVRRWLPARPANSHKGTFGKAMIVAGSVNYTGAAALAGESATRAGAGLVTLALPSAIHTSVAARVAEATYVLLPEAMGVVSSTAAEVLWKALEGYDALLVGPGLGREKETSGFLQKLLGSREVERSLGFRRSEERASGPVHLPPLVIDADGLNLLSELEDWPTRIPAKTVLTPHPGEMARLMGESVATVQQDRIAVARSGAAEWGHVVVLKGAFTVVADPGGRTVIEPFANPGLATAGTGDVLAGTIVALRAQGLSAFDAAAAGAYVHGLAGEIAREGVGAMGMVAGDVMACLPEALRRIGVT
ncbi:MAG: NAD(P)H-hydrate dehydratase [Anaerolineae bacterium]